MKPPSHGFTLIELLVTLTVAGILFGIALPAFNSFVQNDRDTGQANSLISSFNYARSEAVKRASPNGITVCPSLDGLNCDPAATSWVEGWIVTYVDPLNNAKNVVFQTVPALNGTNTVTPVAGPATGITFRSSGMVSAALTLRICDARGAAFARQVEVLTTGRVAASQQPGKSVGGAALACP
ncbi:MAG: GspH/FimT family pseudopilin [Pseudomonadota bacterium]|nr:GspH/FimT family pseudopilin [Pseudomonadota bacterium]